MILNDKLKKFNDARYGMFIHFGAYTLFGRDCWVQFQEGIERKEYEKKAREFNPVNFDAHAFAKLAKNSGMKYIVFGTKHHDGFCLFNTKYTDFNSVKTCGRDLTKEMVDACREEGLMVGLYFSVKDWSFPCYFTDAKSNKKEWKPLVEHFHNQTIELMSNYGKIDILFFDCADDCNMRGFDGITAEEVFESEKLVKKVRELQPDILINDRSGYPCDYTTPEQQIPDAIYDDSKFYESCITLNNNWAYVKGDDFWKTSRQVLFDLTCCAARGVNLLLNVGPKPDGTIPNEYFDVLLPVGDWLKKYGECIYGTERILENYWDWGGLGRITTKGNTAYNVLLYWDDGNDICTAYLNNNVIKAEILGSENHITVEKNGRQLRFSNISKQEIDKLGSVLKITLKERPKANVFFEK